MSEFNIEVQGGSSVRLPTAGKYCEKDIIVTASGGSGTEEIENFFTEIRTFTCEGNNTIVKTPLLDCINLSSLQSAFLGCSNLKEVYVKNTHNVKVWTHALNSPRITTIETLDFSSASSIYNSWCGSDFLENIKIVPNTIKASIFFCSRELTVESIQNIIDGLVDLTGATAQTLTINANSKARVTDEQKIEISKKNWNLA